MALTNATSWTNMTVDIFRNNPHIDCRPNGALLKTLTPKTLDVGFRMVSRQSRPTEGKFSVRLDAWKYIRRVSIDDMLQALRELGYMTSSLKEQVRETMMNQQVYHVVIRGNDPSFMPLGNVNGQDIPTSYLLESMDFVHDEVDKLLFDELDSPDAICAAMNDAGFDQLLEVYFKNGDTVNEEALHVVSRFKAGSNLLHTCIKEGHMETLQLLLNSYTVESHGHAARWRVLAEPLRRCGKFKCSAFHRAVFDGRSECLRLLVEWARRHGHDITKIVNVEERDGEGEASKEFTCLELAEQEQNLECYNILAPVFNVPLKESSTNATSREARMADMGRPRIELLRVSDAKVELLQTVEVEACDMTWNRLVDVAKQLRLAPGFPSQELCKMSIRACNLIFDSDATEAHIDELFAAAEGMYCIEALGCVTKSEITCLSTLKILVRRLSLDSPEVLPPRMPSKVTLYCSLLPQEEQATDLGIHLQLAQLICAFVKVCGRWPKFFGAPRLIDAKQCAGFVSNNKMEAVAACRAAQFACRLPCFLFHNEDSDAVDTSPMEDWLRKQALMAFPRAIKSFFNEQYLLHSNFEDPLRALDAHAIIFIDMVLSAWFATAPLQFGNDPWSDWAKKLGVSETVTKSDLAPAVDRALASTLRMWKALDGLCKKAKVANVSSIGDLIIKHVPLPLLARLPSTRARLEKYHSKSTGEGLKKDVPKVSLLSQPSKASLRPGGGRGKMGKIPLTKV